MPELVFFVGKGGVGKTTVSSAYAVHVTAGSPQQSLLLSTDPAHSLSDVFQARIGGARKLISAGSSRRLSAVEVDSERVFRSFIDEHREDLVDAVERGSLFTAAEISSLLDTALPGISEMGALLAIDEAIQSGKYSTIIVDTAPFGHTLRLFGLAQQFARLLDFLELAAERDQVLAQHFGGRVDRRGRDFIVEWREKLQQINHALQSTQIFLVTTGESFALNESIRCIRELENADPPLKLSGIVLNRMVRQADDCRACESRVREEKKAARQLSKAYRRVPLYQAKDPGFPILGVADLKKLGDSIFGKKAAKWRSPKSTVNVAPVRTSSTEWPMLSAPLTFVLGKGGVGKTTVSAALGWQARRKGEDEVQVCSVDPAPSLDDVFETEVGDEPRSVLGDRGFQASELDSVALYKSWVAEMRASIDAATSATGDGIQIDLSYERKLFSELLEIVPPGLDEVLAIFRIIEASQGSRKVIIDMAPTGHALELLRTPQRILVWARLLLKSLESHRKLALAREAAVKIAELEVRARELSLALKGSRAAVYAVMLPEPLPDRETERLLRYLQATGIKPKAVFVNRVFALVGNGKAKAECDRCMNAAAWQAQVFTGLKKRLRMKTVYVIPAFERGPAGKQGLREITRKLWQLA